MGKQVDWNAVRRVSAVAAAVGVMVRASFRMPTGAAFSVYLMPWDCLDEAVRIGRAIGATYLGVREPNGGELWTVLGREVAS